MLAIWWLDANGNAKTKWGIRTLKSGAEYLNLLSVSPSRPSFIQAQTTIKFRARTVGGQEKPYELSAVDVFAEVSKPEVQEWQIK
jgi:hypothetical protein